MASKTKRAVLALGSCMLLGLSLTPMGCGGGIEEAGSPAQSHPTTPQLPAAPEEVVAKLTACATQGATRLTLESYAILLDVKANDDGHIGGVVVKDSMLNDPAIESCMVRALEGMSLPASVMALRGSRRVSEGVVAPPSRSLVGNAVVVGGVVVNLLPIVIVAAGVTVVVAVTV